MKNSFDFFDESDKKAGLDLERDEAMMSVNDFHCDKCGKQFTKEKDFIVHMKCHEKNPKAAFDPISINGITDNNVEKGFDLSNESDTKVEIKLEKDRVTLSSNRFNCEKCGKRFVKEKDFIVHMKCHEKNPNADFGQICEICNESFPKKNYIRHLNSKHPSKLSPKIKQQNLLKTKANLEKKIYTCRKCIYETSDEEMLKDHVSKQQHGGNLVNQLANCPYCDKKIAKGYPAVKAHIDDKHPDKGDKNYFCDVCNKGFIFESSYKRHNHIKAKKEPTRLCEICNLKVYSLLSHKEEKHQFCPYCDYKPKLYKHQWQANLKFHIDSKHSELVEKKFFCNLCPKSFTFKSTFSQHLHSHTKTEKKFVCELCAIEYTTSQSLKEHLLRSHPLPDATDFVCDVCGFSTFSKTKLNRHRFVKHEIEKHQVCPYCEFRCPDKQNLHVHIDRKHPEHGEKQFFCDICGKGFIFKQSLHDHPLYYCPKNPKFKGNPNTLHRLKISLQKQKK